MNVPPKNINVPFHRQDKDNYCGSACAQMLLDSIGAGIIDQDSLYSYNQNHSINDPGVIWKSAPTGLQWTLNNLRPSNLSYYFGLNALGTEKQVTRKYAGQ